MTELEERMLGFVAEQTGIKRERVQLASRLSQDVGVEGDDAVEFFEKFREAFQTDLTVLHEQWDRHFLPEASPHQLGCLLAMGPGLASGIGLAEAIRWRPAWALLIIMPALFCWIYIKIFNGKQHALIPVRVQDLVDAAAAGHWVMAYTSPEESKLGRAAD